LEVGTIVDDIEKPAILSPALRIWFSGLPWFLCSFCSLVAAFFSSGSLVLGVLWFVGCPSFLFGIRRFLSFPIFGSVGPAFFSSGPVDPGCLVWRLWRLPWRTLLCAHPRGTWFCFNPLCLFCLHTPLIQWNRCEAHQLIYIL